MAKKKDLTSKITGGVQSWKTQADQIVQPAEPEPEKKSSLWAGKYMRKTYTLPESTVDRVSELAAQYGIGKSELARYLLDYALSQVESGKHELPLKVKHTLE